MNSKLPRKPVTRRDALIIAHAQGRINRENLLKELEKLDCGSIEAQLGGRYPALISKRKGDIVMYADAGVIGKRGYGI